MTTEELKELVDGDYNTLYEVVSKLEKKIKLGTKTISITDAIRQYDPYHHDVNDPSVREKRKLEIEGEEYTDSITQETKSSVQYDEVEVNRLQLARQKQIVQSAVFFECGASITLDFTGKNEKENEFFELIKKVWDDNKLSFKTEDIVERRMIETHCAELWYDYTSEDYWDGTMLEGSTRKPGMLLLCKENGDDIFPVWNEHNEFVGLGRKYERTNIITDLKTLHFDFYTGETIIFGRQQDGESWESVVREGYGFLALIYHSQPRPEWSDTQPLSNREETNFSNIADTNDYYGDPAMVVEGEAESLPSKGEVAKVIQVKGTSDGGRGSVSFAQPDAMVESKKMEFEKLKQEQFDITNTPDISFNTMSQLMSNGTSGIALRLLFMGPQLKGNKAQKRLHEMLVRRINVIKKMLISFSTAELSEMKNVNPAINFKDALPVNKQELIGNVTSLVNAKLLSRKTAITMLGEVSDVEAELNQILEETRAEAKIEL
ncbi:phage portal protein [Sphingobacterium corticibacter]|uniref:Phage portal protein n=1 Tax=Sphingobacterium corticibacter TaxID=2171749 RepID=A0A2T8HLI6_9SPHI|nr:phage portal protein [Sphingobacterium corticibacter]PVH26314.1 hypothetical protein DC487_01415 [Sphingobacterium corticibacter]